MSSSKNTADFEGQKSWREMLRITDEQGVEKVRHSVTRAAASLPTLILIALAPKEGNQALLIATGVGLIALLRNRTAGVFLLLGTALALPLSMLHTHGVEAVTLPSRFGALLLPVHLHQLGMLSSALLVAATLPYLRPMVQFLRGR